MYIPTILYVLSSYETPEKTKTSLLSRIDPIPRIHVMSDLLVFHVYIYILIVYYIIFCDRFTDRFRINFLRIIFFFPAKSSRPSRYAVTFVYVIFPFMSNPSSNPYRRRHNTIVYSHASYTQDDDDVSYYIIFFPSRRQVQFHLEYLSAVQSRYHSTHIYSIYLT